MPEDIEDLKVNKIEPSPQRTSLPTVHDAPQVEPLEAYGGSGQAPAGPIDKGAMNQHIVATLKTIYDPEIPLNIYDLGLIYDLEVSDHAEVEVKMTLTAPGCPVADYLVREVATKVGEVPGVATSHVTLVWDPPWTKDRMSEEAMLELGLL